MNYWRGLVPTLALFFSISIQADQSFADQTFFDELPNFHEVDANSLYRSGAPTPEGIRTMAKLNVRTVLDLRDDDPDGTRKEAQLARELGMKFISIPLNSFVKPRESTMNSIAAILNDPTQRPLWVHCTHGRDRTGLVIGLYRVFSQGVTPREAYYEMLDYGFRSLLLGLRLYYLDQTGY